MPDVPIPIRDLTILRELARRVAEIAALPIQQERIELWKALNEMRPIRPVVAVYPERAWDEMLPASLLQCEHNHARNLEMDLRRRIYHHEHVADDRPIHADILIAPAWGHSGLGVHSRTIHADGHDGPEAYTWDPPIKTMADTEKMRVGEVTVDLDAMRRAIVIHDEIFDGVLNVRHYGSIPFWSVGISQLAQLRGLGQAMMDMYDNPDILHAILSVLRDDRMHLMDVFEREGYLTPNNDVTPIHYFIGSGHEGYTDELPAADYRGVGRWKDMWGLGEMQEFSGVGPAQFEEFSLQYQLPMLDRFGLVDYGCCEPLDRMYDLLLARIPKLRRVSITTPYASKRIAAEKLAGRCIFDWKPNPTWLATEVVDWDGVEADIRETLDVARGMPINIIMKSTETFRNQPDRVGKYVDIALRLACEMS